MPRLIDDMRARTARLACPHFVSPSKQLAWKKMAKFLHDSVIMNPELPVIEMSNVSRYYYESEQEYWDLRDDFPNLAPPYPAMWFESKMQKRIHSKDCGDTDVAALVPNGRVGAVIHALDPATQKFEGEPPAGTKWVLWCELYIDFGRRGVTCEGPHGSIFLCVSAEGAILETPWMQSYIDDVHHDPQAVDLMESIITWLYPAFLTICFLHCKNVTMVENAVPKPLAKKYREKHGITPTSYKTLVIEPLKQILRREGGSDKVGVQKALHICRGHFRDYREGRGLFGKYHGQFWMPSIVRGSKGEKAPPREIEVKV